MKQKTRDIQEWIKQRYNDKYQVRAEIDNKIKLKCGKFGWYQPDVLLRDKGTGQIKYVIEIEGDPVRKALVGASILADYSTHRSGSNPKLIFVIWTKEGLKQLDDFKKKLKIAKYYCRHLKSIEIYTENDFKSLEL